MIKMHTGVGDVKMCILELMKYGIYPTAKSYDTVVQGMEKPSKQSQQGTLQEEIKIEAGS